MTKSQAADWDKILAQKRKEEQKAEATTIIHPHTNWEDLLPPKEERFYKLHDI